jgi:DNA polymerase I-like protein with 3'-5' exonuclease and polymerase domains
VPSRGNKERVLFACDYSQKEVRILAHMCQDQALRSLFTDDKKNDIYKQMASLIRNKPVETVESEERAHFKQVTLAILYGMRYVEISVESFLVHHALTTAHLDHLIQSPKQVAKNLSITEDAAKRTMSDFFRRFSTLKRVGVTDQCVVLDY